MHDTVKHIQDVAWAQYFGTVLAFGSLFLALKGWAWLKAKLGRGDGE